VQAVLKPNRFSLFVLIATCCAIELALVLSDRAVIMPQHVRQLAYDYGAFWPGLLGNWKPNYAAQPYTMFFTYSFLHGGIVHLVVNMISLWSLGNAVLSRVGQVSFVILYFGASLGGSAVFGVLAPTLRPMVGASGSLFGLLGAIVAWDYLDRYSNLEGLWDAGRVVALLIGLNLVLWWAMDGQLAWQTHLGGFLAGWIVALLIKQKPLEDS
jgi:membrane associated rhomboid family serine protease